MDHVFAMYNEQSYILQSYILAVCAMNFYPSNVYVSKALAFDSFIGFYLSKSWPNGPSLYNISLAKSHYHTVPLFGVSA